MLPLSADSFVQENWGVANPGGTTSVVIPLTGGNNPSGVATTAGNAVLIFLTAVGSGITPPTGFTNDKSITSTAYVFRNSEIAAGVTSWTATLASASSTDLSFYVVELQGVDAVEPLDASASNGPAAVGDGGTHSTGTTTLNAALNTVVFAVFVAPSGVAPTWSNYTPTDFEEVQEVTTGSPGYRLAVARRFVTGQTGTFETTATLASTGSSNPTYGLIVAYRAADSPIVAPLAAIAGFEPGTHGGATASTGVNSLFGSALAPVGTWGTTYLVQASSARNSGYGLRIVRSAATGAVRIGVFSSRTYSAGMNVRVVSGSGIAIVAGAVDSGGINISAALKYDFSTSKFGIGSDWQDGTTALNTWVWVEWRYSPATGQFDWRLETAADTYTDQPSTDFAPGAGSVLTSLQLGRSFTSETATIDYDDVVVSPYWSAYPLGPHEVRLLTVDPAGTPTLSGTSTNFSVFTANGTLAAWNAVNARDAVDEVPPTISASADGVCQTAVAASDYIEFPMAACVLAADEVVVGVRMLAAMWGGTGSGTGTIGLRGWDGTTETTLVAASVSYDPGSPTAVSSTEPYWQCAIWPSSNGWTQAELDALALRFGFSTDATPDMGVHALYLEYATRKTVTTPLFGDLVSRDDNPNTLGARSVTATPTAGYDASLHVDQGGSPTDTATPGGASTTQTLDAADDPAVEYVALYPPAEDISDA